MQGDVCPQGLLLRQLNGGQITRGLAMCLVVTACEVVLSETASSARRHSYSGSVQELRVLPLISSATEIVHALGLGQFQVGRSHECDYPPSVASLPVCTRPTVAVSGSSADIDQRVKERVASALSVYHVDSALVKSLPPTHIITQTQCKVC